MVERSPKHDDHLSLIGILNKIDQSFLIWERRPITTHRLEAKDTTSFVKPFDQILSYSGHRVLREKAQQLCDVFVVFAPKLHWPPP